jgi:predicted nucleic acid-binding protein
MEPVFVDTSALFALLVQSDKYHIVAADSWRKLIAQNAKLHTTNYVAVESIALIQGRNGLSSVRILVNDFLPMLEIVWLDKEVHEMAIQHILTANRRNLSLVDCSSFETMRRLGIKTVFSFDEHFRKQGFNVIPN